MNALFLHRNARIGGANTYLITVMPELVSRGHRTHLMIGLGPLLPRLRAATESRVRLNPPLDSLSERLVTRTIRRHSIDVVNAHTVNTGRVALRACASRGIPFVQHVHSLVPLDESADVLQGADRVVVMNRSVENWVKQIDGVAEKTFLSRLAVDRDRFSLRGIEPHEGFNVLYCGRLSRRKAAHAQEVVGMLHTLEEQAPGITLTIVGGRSQAHLIRNLGAQANRALGRRAVRITGETLNPAELIAGADVVIGTGYVVLEALATGRHTIGVGIQGMTGLVTRENLSESIEANFGDHDATIHDVTRDVLAAEIVKAYEAWKQSPVLAWGPEVISQEFSARRAANDLEDIFTALLPGG